MATIIPLIEGAIECGRPRCEVRFAGESEDGDAEDGDSEDGGIDEGPMRGPLEDEVDDYEEGRNFRGS